jgi:hypothetical protein
MALGAGPKRLRKFPAEAADAADQADHADLGQLADP